MYEIRPQRHSERFPYDGGFGLFNTETGIQWGWVLSKDKAVSLIAEAVMQLPLGPLGVPQPKDDGHATPRKSNVARAPRVTRPQETPATDDSEPANSPQLSVLAGPPAYHPARHAEPSDSPVGAEAAV